MPAALRRGVLLLTGVLACTPNPRPTADAPAPAPAPEVAPAKEEPPPPVVAAKPKAKREPVEVVVRELGGGVVAGATVHVGDETRVTDERGVVVVPGGTTVSVTAPGFAALRADVPRRKPTELYLMPASTIAGRVIDERGRPLAGVDVELKGHGRDGVTKTDADGRFSFSGLDPGRRLLTVRGGVIADRMVAVGLAETATIEVKAERAATISGVAVHAETGAPCRGGHVTLYVGLEEASDGCPICGGKDPTVDAPIADDGTVRVEVARGLVYGLEIACHGALKEMPDPVFVADADVSGLRWRVSRGLQIRGAVVDDKGKPLPGIEIHLRSADGEPLPEMNGDDYAKTDEDGRFALEGLVDETYELEAYGDTDVDYSGERKVTLADVDLDNVVIVAHGKPQEKDDDDDATGDAAEDEEVAAPARVRGVVRDAGGEPVAGAVVIVSDDDGDDNDVTRLLWRRWDGRAPALSGADGSFDAPAPAPRNRRDEDDDAEGDEGTRQIVFAFAPGGAVGIGVVGAKPAEVRVRPLAAITVKVRDRRGKPIVHYGVDLARERPRPEYVHAPGGMFTIPGFLPSSQRVRIHTPEGDVGQTVAVGTSPVVVDYAVRGAIDELTIYLVDVGTRDDIAGCKVAIGPVGGPRKPPVVTDDGGMALFTDVPTGPAQIDVLACAAGGKRYAAQSKRLLLRPDAEWLTMSIAGHEAGGKLGYTLEARRAGVSPLPPPLRVKSVARGGPAERAGLKVGDVIVSVGTTYVGGRNGYLHDGLTRVAAGASVTLGLADGREVELKAE